MWDLIKEGMIPTSRFSSVCVVTFMHKLSGVNGGEICGEHSSE